MNPAKKILMKKGLMKKIVRKKILRRQIIVNPNKAGLFESRFSWGKFNLHPLSAPTHPCLFQE